MLVVPGAPFATQVWGTSHDEPLQVLGNSPWGVRDSIPLTPPETIRALDSVQRLFAAGRPSAGLADTLARQGISYVMLRNDLDPETSRSARPILVHRAIDGSPVYESGAVRRAGRPRHAVGIHQRQRTTTPVSRRGDLSRLNRRPRRRSRGPPTWPTPTPGPRRRRARGAVAVDERRRLLGQPPLGPMLMTGDAASAGLAVPRKAGVTVTDTPVARETDYGRVDDHSSAIRAADDARHTFNRVPDYPAPGADDRLRRLDRRPAHGVQFGLGRHRAARRRHRDLTRRRSRRRFGHSWVSNALQSAVGQWLQVDFDHPVTNATITITPSATAVGAQVRRIEVSTVNGTTHAAIRPGRQTADRGAAVRRDAVGADHRRRPPTTVRPVCSSASPT